MQFFNTRFINYSFCIRGVHAATGHYYYAPIGLFLEITQQSDSLFGSRGLPGSKNPVATKVDNHFKCSLRIAADIEGAVKSNAHTPRFRLFHELPAYLFIHIPVGGQRTDHDSPRTATRRLGNISQHDFAVGIRIEEIARTGSYQDIYINAGRRSHADQTG